MVYFSQDVRTKGTPLLSVIFNVKICKSQQWQVSVKKSRLERLQFDQSTVDSALSEQAFMVAAFGDSPGFEH